MLATGKKINLRNFSGLSGQEIINNLDTLKKTIEQLSELLKPVLIPQTVAPKDKKKKSNVCSDENIRNLFPDIKFLSGQDVCRILNISRQAVHKRRVNGELLGVRLGGKKEFYYPDFQFADSPEKSDLGLIIGIKEVLKNLQDKGLHPWTIFSFLANPCDRFKNMASPVEMLKKGHLKKVLEACKTYLEHGAS